MRKDWTLAMTMLVALGAAMACGVLYTLLWW